MSFCAADLRKIYVPFDTPSCAVWGSAIFGVSVAIPECTKQIRNCHRPVDPSMIQTRISQITLLTLLSKV